MKDDGSIGIHGVMSPLNYADRARRPCTTLLRDRSRMRLTGGPAPSRRWFAESDTPVKVRRGTRSYRVADQLHGYESGEPGYAKVAPAFTRPAGSTRRAPTTPLMS